MRYNGPKVKLSRALGIALTPKAAEVMKKKPYPPGAHGNVGRRRKSSDFKMQLLEKQRLKAQYNVSERQLRRYYEMALKGRGNTGDNLVEIMETRLDALVYRAGFSRTIYAARQYVGHGHITVDGKKVDIPSYRVRLGQVFAVKSRSRNLPHFVEASESGASTVPYLSVDHRGLSARFASAPARHEIPVQCEAQTIVEYYSR